MEEDFTIIQGDCLEELDKLGENSVDAIVTDPPYELNFMGKGWDNAGVSFNKETWKKCMRVLKPGGYMLAFGGTRTYHRIACAVEDAGFEIRDCVIWLYGSGFPKSMNIGLAIDKKNGIKSEVVGEGKSGVSSRAYQSEETTTAGYYQIKQAQNQWAGWGTALKPSYEPIIVARKPFKGSCVDNVIKYGVGGINIDECRVGNEELHNSYAGNKNTGFTSGDERDEKGKGMFSGNKQGETIVNGRFPANTILDTQDGEEWRRYFYCAKASRKDRDEGLPDKWLNSLEIILYNNIGDELWKDKITIKEGDEAKHLEDMGVSLQKAIEEYGTQTKKDIDLNTLLYGRKSLEKYLKENKYTTKTGISSTTISQILNLLTLYTIEENTQDVKLETENGINHVEIVENINQLEIIIKEHQELAPGANNVVLKMLLKINEKEGRNEHCTVKPTSLMQYLVRLVSPKGATILDPFMGSGSTGKAVAYENLERDAGYKFIGIEKDPEYCEIAKARIKYVVEE